jgi:hypothetical protein
VTLTATVTSSGLGINEGTVTFSIFQGGTQVGTSVTSNTVSDGTANAVYTVPAGLPLGTYTIQAVYNPGPDYQASSDNTHTLTVAIFTAATTTVVTDATVPFSENSQTVTLNATVTGGAAPVSEGTVTFSVFEGTTQIGASVTSGTVSNGAAVAIYSLPAGQTAGTYTVQAIYNPGPDYLTSSDDSHTLTVAQDATSTTVSGTSTTFSTSSQSISLTASVTNPITTVGEGTVTFTVLNNGVPVGTPVAASVSGGSVSIGYTLPAALAAGSYSLLVKYSDSSGNFLASDNSANLGVLFVVPAATTTSVDSAEVVFSTSAQAVTFNAQVTSTGGIVNGGTVTFSVLDAGGNPIGNPVDSPAIVAGAASGSFIVPAGTPAGKYTIQAFYNGTADFGASQPATGTLTVDGGPNLPRVDGTNSITLSFNQFPASIPLNATSAAGNPLTYSTTMVSDNPIFDLQQQYQFQGVGYGSAGAYAYVLHSGQPATDVNGAASGVGGYYLLRPADGALFAYDGSGSYAHTFANGTPITTLGADVYNDPALLLNAQPPADYTTLYNLQKVYQFTELGVATAGGAKALVLQSLATNLFANPYYLVRPSDGALFAYDGSGSFAHSFANSTPLATLGSSVFSYPAALLNAEMPPNLYPQLHQLNQQYDLQEYQGSFYTNTYGHQAQWIYSPTPNQYGQHWYTLALSPDGTQALLRAWQGYADSATGAVLATLDASVYSNPSWLTTAAEPPLPPGSASVYSSGNLNINLLNNTYLGTFKVNVTVSDGLLSTSQTVTVSSVDTAPTLTIQQGSSTIASGSTLSVPHASFPQSFTVAATSTSNATVTASVSVSSYSAAFALQHFYQFKGLGYSTAGATAYVLQAGSNSSLGNPYFLLKSDGGLYAYDGSGSFAHTFANVTPLANLGAAAYADPSLLLNAQPPVNYSQLYTLQQQYQFQALGNASAGASAFVLKANANNSFGNPYYLLSGAGGLFAYDGSGSFTHTFANVTPVATLDPGVYVNPALLTGALASPGLYPQLLAAEQRYDLSGLGYGIAGAPAYVLSSPSNNLNGNHYYLLNSNGGVYAYDGSGSYAHTFANSANLVVTLDPLIYSNPALLTSAKAPEAAAGVTASLVNGTLTLNAPTSFVGTLQVAVTATDGIQSNTETFQVVSSDTAPVPNVVGPQSISLSNPRLTLTLGASDAENDTLTYSAVGVGYSVAYVLQQQYHFQGVGKSTTSDGVSAYVLQVAGTNAFGNPYYLISASGAVYAYDGSGSFGHSFGNSLGFVAQLDPSVFNTPTLLTNAQPPATTAAIQSAVQAPVGNQLTINVAGLPIGTIFEVLVNVSDGAETSNVGFLVTVTA